jgi:Bacterial Ig domain
MSARDVPCGGVASRSLVRATWRGTSQNSQLKACVTVRDTTAPAVSLTAPSNGATISGSSVTISATASDAVGVAGVQFKLDTNTNIGAEDTSSPYSVTWNSTGVADGSHTLTAVAHDAAVNYATSTGVSITVDNTAPVISSIVSSTDTISATITWTTNEASDSRVDYGLTTSYGIASTSATLVTSHSLTLTGLAAHTVYHFRIQSTDGSNNTTTSSDQTFTTSFLLSLASSKLVDLVMIGDSNQLMNGTGFDDGFGLALATRYQLYASPLYAQEITGTAFSNQGFASGAVSGATSSATSGADAGFDAFIPTTNFPYLYQASGDIGTSNGISYGGSSGSVTGLDVTANLRAWFAYGTFASGSGSFRPAWRRENSPFSVLVNGAVINTNTGAIGQAIGHLDLPAAARAYPVGYKWRVAGGTASVGPTLEFWQRIENMDRSTGISVSSLYGAGGSSLYDMASWIQGQSDVELTNYFSAIRYLQVQAGQSPTVVVYINSGFNDRNETSQPSLGPNPSAVPSSAAAYVDNLKAVVNRVEGIWTLNGWDLNNLAFLVVPSHPISDPDDTKIVSYRAAATTYAESRQRVTVVDVSQLITSAAMTSAGYYLAASGNIHLVQSGYEALATLIANLF